MKGKANFVFVLLAVVLGFLAATIFTVDQRQFAIIFQLGEVKDVITEPGLKFKVPLIQNVRYFDRRILTLDTSDPERLKRRMCWWTSLLNGKL